jgi:predicted HAD superfamily Cof-like phosphohydrolase
MSDYQIVRQYQEDNNVDCCDIPTLISKDEGKTMLENALVHLRNFSLTITNSFEESNELMYNSLGVDPSLWEEKSELELIEDQEDAICDTWVYMLNVATEFGLLIFIDPSTGGSDRNRKEDVSVMSDYQMVKTFTTAAGTVCFDNPTIISKDRGVFLLRHSLSELHEFALTVTNSTDEAHGLLKDCLDALPKIDELARRSLIESQEDSICGVWVALLKVAAKHGQDVSSMMKVVMKSNMAKIDPVTGKCNRRESDGKIMKPDGWTPPNTKEEILRQILNGTSL